MALSNLDSTKLYVDLDALSPRANTANDSSADQVQETSGVYTTDGGSGGGEIVVDAPNKKFYFQAAAGNNFEFAGSGITGQALYSFFKYLWKNVESISKFDFPMLSITNEQFEFINGWYPDDSQAISQTVSLQPTGVEFDNTNSRIYAPVSGGVDLRKFVNGDTITVTGTTNNNTTFTVSSSGIITLVGVDYYVINVSVAPTAETNQSPTITAPFSVTTSDLIRTAGWTVQDTGANYVKDTFAGTITLGSLVDVVDQPYYIQADSPVAKVSNLRYTGPANEAVSIKSVANASLPTASPVADITFTNATSTISTSTTDLSVFKDGDTIVITGGTANDGTYTITGTPTATSLVVNESITDESNTQAIITADRTSNFKLFVRERRKTYADSDLADIGVQTMTYIVYRYPVSNATDLDILTDADTDIDADGAVPASEAIYSDIQISYLTGTNGDYNILGNAGAGTYAVDDVLKDDAGRWYAVTGAGTLDATDFTDLGTLGGAGTATVTAYEGERYIKDGYYAFTVIIDADDTFVDAGGTTPYVNGAKSTQTVEAVYEFSQWALRLAGQLNEGATGGDIKNGQIADLLVEFVGPTLVTKPGVFVQSLAAVDQNSIQFTEASNGDLYTGASNLTYPRVVSVIINFNTNLAADPDAVFYAYYKTGTADYGTVNAVQVVKTSPVQDVGTDVTNNVPDEATEGAGSTYTFQYDYDGDTTNGRTGGTETDIVVVGIGLDTGQYVKAEGTISAAGGTVSLVAPLERNFLDPVA